MDQTVFQICFNFGA